MKAKPTLHLMVGLPCSGKTTEAKRLERQINAIRFTPDEWMTRIIGSGTIDPDHDRRHSEIEMIMWELAERLLPIGVSVILDYGFWAREERDWFRARAHALGADFQIHSMDVPEAELYQRLEHRNAANAGDVFIIPPEEMARYITLFEAPTPDEL